MPLLARAVFTASKNHAEPSIQILRRFGFSRKFFSSLSRRYGSSNISSLQSANHGMVVDHLGQNRLMNHVLSKRYCSSSRRPMCTAKPEAGNSWRSLLIPGFAITGIGGLFFLIHSNDQRRAVPKGKGEKFERSAIQGPIIGGPFSLTDTEGRLVTEKNLLGNWVLLYFGYTSSPDVGPAEIRKMVSSINTLEFDSRMMGLTGPVAAIRQIAQECRVFFRKVDEEGGDYLVESSHNMYLLNPNMEVARSFGIEYSADDLTEAIAKEIKKSEPQAIAKE